MGEAIRPFRREVSRELGDRQGAERRYSAGLRQTAVAYWREREQAGDRLASAPRRWASRP